MEATKQVALAPLAEAVMIQAPEEIQSAAMTKWSGISNVPPEQLQNFCDIAVAYGLNPVLGEIVLLNHKGIFSAYPTVKGMMKILSRKGLLDGFSTHPPRWHGELAAWEVKAEIWIKGCNHPFTGYGYASPASSQIKQTHDHAATRALGRIARNIAAMPLPTAEEMAGEGAVSVEDMELAQASEVPEFTPTTPEQVAIIESENERLKAKQAAGQTGDPELNGQAEAAPASTAPASTAPPASEPPKPPEPLPDDCADYVAPGTGFYMVRSVEIKEGKNGRYARVKIEAKQGSDVISIFNGWQEICEFELLLNPAELQAGFYRQVDMKAQVEITESADKKWKNIKSLTAGGVWDEDKPKPPTDGASKPAGDPDDVQPPEPAPTKKANAPKLSQNLAAELLYQQRRLTPVKTWDEAKAALDKSAADLFAKAKIAETDFHYLPAATVEGWLLSYKAREPHPSHGGKKNFTMVDAAMWMYSREEWETLGDMGEAIEMDSDTGLTPGD